MICNVGLHTCRLYRLHQQAHAHGVPHWVDSRHSAVPAALSIKVMIEPTLNRLQGFPFLLHSGAPVTTTSGISVSISGRVLGISGSVAYPGCAIIRGQLWLGDNFRVSLTDGVFGAVLVTCDAFGGCLFVSCVSVGTRPLSSLVVERSLGLKSSAKLMCLKISNNKSQFNCR